MQAQSITYPPSCLCTLPRRGGRPWECYLRTITRLTPFNCSSSNNNLDDSSRPPCALSSSGSASLSTHEQVAGYLTSNSSHAFGCLPYSRNQKAGKHRAGWHAYVSLTDSQCTSGPRPQRSPQPNNLSREEGGLSCGHRRPQSEATYTLSMTLYLA